MLQALGQCLWFILPALLAGWLIGAGLRGLRAKRDRDTYEANWHGRLSAANRDLETRQAKLRELDSQLVSLRDKYAKLEADATGLRSRVTQLQPLAGQLQARDQKLAELGTQLSKTREIHSAEIADRQSKADEATQLRAAVQQLGNRRAALAEDKASGDLDAAKRIAALEPLVQQTRDREAELVQLRARVAELEPLPAMVSIREADIAKLRTRVTELEPLPSQLAKADAHSRALDDEITRLKRRIAELDGLADTVRELEASSQQDLSGREIEIERLRRLLNELRARPPRPIEVVRELTAPLALQTAARSLDEQAPHRGASDDLQRIHGVGPRLERFLNDRGVLYFAQVAAWSSSDIAKFEMDLPQFKGRIQREDWVQSARAEHIKKYGVEP